MPKKLGQLKRLMDEDVEVFDAMERAMAIAEKKDRLKLPRDDVFVIAYPNKEEYDFRSDNFKNFTNKYFDGDEDDALQNIGLGWKRDVNGLTLFAEGAYNLDSEEIKPAVGASFSF